ncbi:proteoglycan 4-like [Ptychodera flava]|uniref:proteoglycan 4-like n=1 Tax=Ptychodera flava TaxID=63121 RepID=UPI00396A6DB5
MCSWEEWGEWSDCSVLCLTGQRTRVKSCLTSDGAEATDCDGEAEEHEDCDMGPCDEWTHWSEWTECSQSCQGGTRQRERNCLNKQDDTISDVCQGDAMEAETCNDFECREGDWTEWSEWSPCSTVSMAGCMEGTRQRLRECQVIFADGTTVTASSCPGEETNVERCYPFTEECEHLQSALVVTWTLWSSWSHCDCVSKTRRRERACDKVNQDECGGETLQTESCTPSTCNRYGGSHHESGGWEEWSMWSECSVTCGQGVITRERTCRQGMDPVTGRHNCPGDAVEADACYTDKLCIDGTLLHELHVGQGMGAKLHCLVDWYLKQYRDASVHWLKNDQLFPIEGNRKLINYGDLEIMSVKAEDSGIYACGVTHRDTTVITNVILLKVDMTPFDPKKIYGADIQLLSIIAPVSLPVILLTVALGVSIKQCISYRTGSGDEEGGSLDSDSEEEEQKKKESKKQKEKAAKKKKEKKEKERKEKEKAKKEKDKKRTRRKRKGNLIKRNRKRLKAQQQNQQRQNHHLMPLLLVEALPHHLAKVLPRHLVEVHLHPRWRWTSTTRNDVYIQMEDTNIPGQIAKPLTKPKTESRGPPPPPPGRIKPPPDAADISVAKSRKAKEMDKSIGTGPSTTLPQKPVSTPSPPPPHFGSGQPKIDHSASVTKDTESDKQTGITQTKPGPSGPAPPPPSGPAPPPPDLSDVAKAEPKPESSGRGDLLKDIQKKRTEPTVGEKAAPKTPEIKTESKGEKPKSVGPAPPPPSGPAPPPPDLSDVAKAEPKPESSGRGDLLKDIQKKRTEPTVGEKAAPKTPEIKTESIGEKPKSVGAAPPPPSGPAPPPPDLSGVAKAEPKPESSGRGDLLKDIQKKSTEPTVGEKAAPKTPEIKTESKGEKPKSGGAAPPPPSGPAPPPPDLSDVAKAEPEPESSGRGDLLKDIQKKSTEPTVGEKAAPKTPEIKTESKGEKPKSVGAAPPPPSGPAPPPPDLSEAAKEEPKPESSGRGDLLKDIQKRRTGPTVGEGAAPKTPEKETAGKGEKPKSGGAAPPPPSGPAPPPPDLSEAAKDEPKPDSSGRGDLLKDIQKRRTGPTVGEGAAPKTPEKETAGKGEKPKSVGAAPPPPSGPALPPPDLSEAMKDEPKPDSSGRGDLLKDIQKKRTEPTVGEKAGAKTPEKKTASKGVKPKSVRPSSPPPSGPVTPPPDLSDAAKAEPKPDSSGRGDLLKDIQKRRTEPTVGEGAAPKTPEKETAGKGEKPKSVEAAPPPPSGPAPPPPDLSEAAKDEPKPESSGRGDLLKDIQKRRTEPTVGEKAGAKTPEKKTASKGVKPKSVRPSSPPPSGPVTPPPDLSDAAKAEPKPDSSGRGDLLKDIQKRRTEPTVGEGAAPKTPEKKTASKGEKPKSGGAAPPPPSGPAPPPPDLSDAAKDEPKPDSSGRGDLLKDIQKRRT